MWADDNPSFTLSRRRQARVRRELAKTFITAEDEGRPVEVITGATAATAVDRTSFVQALGAWAWPRGPFGSGPTALLAAGFSF